MELSYLPIKGESRKYRILLAVLGILVLGLLISYMVAYLKGFQVWGINNAIPWGQLITLDIYFIGLSAGAIVVSGLCYVLRREEFKPIGRIAVFTGLMIFAGAMVCVLLDLGRPEKFWRLFTYGYLSNMTSMFAINSIWYGAYILLMLVYLWLAMENKTKLAIIVGTIDILWALGVHTFTGAIFGIISTREILYSSIKPFEFIAAALTSGTALLIIVVAAAFKFANRKINKKVLFSLGKLLSVIIIVLLIMVFFDKFTHVYFPHREGTIFLFTGPYWWLFWIFQIGMGIVLPLIILLNPRTARSVKGVVIASISVVIGVLGERAALVIPGMAQVQQFYPGNIEGMWGAAGAFRITFWETSLSIGIVALVVLLFMLGLKFLDLLPAEEAEEAPPPSEEPIAPGEEESVSTAEG